MLELVGLGAALVLVLVLVRFRVTLGYAMVGGALITALSLGKGPLYAGRLVLRALSEWPTIELVVVVALISMLGRAMKEFGLLSRMAASLTRLLRSARAGIVLIPGIIGCLAVPGGAILSAPMVDSLGDVVGLSPVRRAAANLVFRHAWFFVFPFVPTLVLERQLTGLSPAVLIGAQAPFTFTALLVGCLLFLWRPDAPRTAEVPSGQPRGRAALEFLWTAAPIVLALALNLGVGVPLAAALALGLGLTFGQAALARQLTGARARSVLLDRLDLPLLILIAAIMVFKAGVEEMESIPRLIRDLSTRGLPSGLLLVALPGIVGFVSGSQQTALGLGIPLLLGLAPTPAHQPAYAAVIYVAAYMGYLCTPLHLCQVLSAQYFKVSMGSLFRRYAPVVGAVLLVTAAVYLLAVR
ncbi:MAG: DUF401 family protein [Acetobacteraceae bacterium]|nr:DUF401 family protein [Acetobacteraceae bacterium]